MTKHTEGNLPAAVHEAPWHDGDGYRYGGDIVLTVDGVAINLGSHMRDVEHKKIRELAARLALRWNEHEGLVELLERVLSVARAQRVTTAERIITAAPSNETLRAEGAAVLADIEALLARIREGSGE